MRPVCHFACVCLYTYPGQKKAVARLLIPTCSMVDQFKCTLVVWYLRVIEKKWTNVKTSSFFLGLLVYWSTGLLVYASSNRITMTKITPACAAMAYSTLLIETALLFIKQL